MSPLVRSFLFMAGALAFFALHIFVVGPHIQGKGLEVAVFMITRVLTGVILGYLLTRFAGRNRFQSVSSIILVFLIDQVIFKGVWALQDQKIHPELWEGLSNQALFSGLASGFMFFMPVILVVGFIGTEAGLRYRALRA
ncbi:MAG: hypothetical protein EOP09_02575 [Proteobacteria bacterium]|nr:MAG: hypothetical protein EOP09_02575 [Pseudomonadota bacterium]